VKVAIGVHGEDVDIAGTQADVLKCGMYEVPRLEMEERGEDVDAWLLEPHQHKPRKLH
jgi:hypothetical protein